MALRMRKIPGVLLRSENVYYSWTIGSQNPGYPDQNGYDCVCRIIIEAFDRGATGLPGLSFNQEYIQ
jgi:hypothetical protein